MIRKGAFSTIGENVVIGGADYCMRGGFAYPGRCQTVQDETPPAVTVPFGTFGLPVSPELAVTLEQGPAIGPNLTPDPVPETPNPDQPVREAGLWEKLWGYATSATDTFLPRSLGSLRAVVAVAIPGGLLLLLALWAFKKLRR